MAPRLCPHCHVPLPPGDPAVCPACGREVRAAEPEGALAGSPDDRAVTLPAASADETTLTAQSVAGETSVEAVLRACGAETGRYVEQGIIGRGGMGEVALCVERNIRRQVAMKRILAEAAQDPSRRARFVEEAQVTGQLQHPNIVPVYELDRDAQGTIYFTMKPVRGRSLADILQAIRAAGPLPSGEGARRSSPPGEPARAGEGAANAPEHSLADLLHIFLKVCDGVAFAHSRGVVHRDLKPANIMVGDFGEVLVMDWGLAKIVGREDIRAADLVTSDRADSTPELTLDGTAMGTPAYMPPEQANGELDKIDHRSDIYSLGAILYELLTFEKPVEGETPLVVLANAAHGQVVPPEQRTPHRAVSRELSAIAMKCLHKLRSRRYQSVTELQRDITLYLEGRSVSAAPDTFAQAAWKLVKRNRRLSAAIAAAAVILIAVTAFFLVRLKTERDHAVTSERRAIADRKAAQEAHGQRRATALRASEALAREAARAADEARFAVAETRASLAVTVMPDGPWGHYARGVVSLGKRDHADARKHLETALRLDPLHELSKTLLMHVKAKAGELVDAEKLLSRAASAEDWRSWVAAGDTLFDAARYPQAEMAYHQALELMVSDAAVPVPLRSDVRQKQGRSLARATMKEFWAVIRDLPPRDRARRLSDKLGEIHGKDIRRVVNPSEGGLISVLLDHNGGRVRWLDSLAGLPLRSLSCAKTRVRDLTPLRGMPLERLALVETRVEDLGPLRGMPLDSLDVRGTRVSDLTPLNGLPLTHLRCGGTSVRDLGPLRGLRLRLLAIDQTTVSNLAPLEGMPLEVLSVSQTRVTDLTPLRGMPLRYLSLVGTNVDDIGPLVGLPLETLLLSVTRVEDLTALEGMRLKRLDPPGKKQLTHESLKVIEVLEKQGCQILW